MRRKKRGGISRYTKPAYTKSARLLAAQNDELHRIQQANKEKRERRREQAA